MKLSPTSQMLVGTITLLILLQAYTLPAMRPPLRRLEPRPAVTKDFPAVLLESKPIERGGLEFVAVVEEEWRAYPHDIVLQWRVKNVTKEEILLAEPSTCSLIVCGTDGRELIKSSELALPRKVLLRPGDAVTFNFDCEAIPRLANNRPRLEFFTKDGIHETSIDAPDTCTVSLHVHAVKPYPGGTPADPRRWSGEVETTPVSIKITDPTPQLPFARP